MAPLHPFVSHTLLFPPLDSLLCSPCIHCGLPIHLSPHSERFSVLISRSFSSVSTAFWHAFPIILLLVPSWVPRVLALSFPKHLNLLVCNTMFSGAFPFAFAIRKPACSHICSWWGLNSWVPSAFLTCSPTSPPLHVAFPVYFQRGVPLCTTLCAPPSVVSLPMSPVHKPSVPPVFALPLQLTLPRAYFVESYIRSLALLSAPAHVTLWVPPWIID